MTSEGVREKHHLSVITHRTQHTDKMLGTRKNKQELRTKTRKNVPILRVNYSGNLKPDRVVINNKEYLVQGISFNGSLRGPR